MGNRNATSGLTESTLILASQSRYRKELLQRLCLPFECLSPAMDEEALKKQLEARKVSPEKMALELAKAKAESIARAKPGAWVIGSDQLLSLEGEILGKAPTAELAEAQLAKLSGKTHELITAWSVQQLQGAKLEERSKIHVSRIRMRTLSAGEIQRYIQTEKPFDCAGSYKMESLGISLVESIDTSDFTSIIGLPLLELSRLLREIGFNVP